MAYPSARAESNKSPEIPEISSGLVELAGPRGAGKTEWLLRYLARKSKQKSESRVAWIDTPAFGKATAPAIFPAALPEYGLALNRVLFVECPPDQVLWAAYQILKSQVFEWVVLDHDLSSGRAKFEETELRRLQLVSEKSQATVVLLNEDRTRQGSWPISTQLEISRQGVRVIKQRIACRVSGAGGELVGAIPIWGQEAWQKHGLLTALQTG